MIDLIEKLNIFYEKGKLNPSEKKEFWNLVSDFKVKFECVPKELAEKFGAIKAKNTPWKSFSVRSGILLSFITMLFGIVAWIWWFTYFGINQSVPLTIFDIPYWIGFALWMGFIFLIMEGPHELSHLITGYICKIRFNGWGIYKFQPTWDIEYSSYMQSSFNKRALTHLIGTPINLFQFLLHLTITTFLNVNFWLLWIPFLLIYTWLIWKGAKEGYGDLPRFYKEIKRKKLHEKEV